MLIVTGVLAPDDVDSVAKYEIMDTLTGDGRAGSAVSFVAPTKQGSNVCAVGKEAKIDEVAVKCGEVVNPVVVGLLAGWRRTR